MPPIEFKTDVIRPIECLKEGWELIKDQYWLIFAVTLVGMLIAGFVPFGILLGPMFCGIYFCLFQKMNGQPVKFESLFKGFDYFKPAFVASLFLIVPAVVLSLIAYIPLIVMQFAMMQNRNQNPEEVFSYMKSYFSLFTVEMLVLWLVLGSIHALIIFAFPLIVEHKLSGIEAFKLSARAALKNLGGVVGFIAAELALGIVGYFIFCVGVYLTLPIMFAGALVVYRRVFPSPDIRNFNISPLDIPPSPSAFQNAGRAI
ncbi:MAG: hypothetical protein ACR2N3_03750 [Pyrinomonadaceae bacterium]